MPDRPLLETESSGDNSAFMSSGLREGDVLNLGCGRKRIEGAINLDCTPITRPDVIHDLNRTPWPFADNTFREVHGYDVVEHLDNVVRTMEELYRVSAPNAKVFLTVPHFSCANAFTDPTHKHYFSYFSFDYFSESSDLSFYSHARFRMLKRRLLFYPTLASKVVWRIANRYSAAYERRWAWLFPAWYLFFELEVLK
jgi:hypothetical protein